MCDDSSIAVVPLKVIEAIPTFGKSSHHRPGFKDVDYTEVKWEEHPGRLYSDGKLDNEQSVWCCAS
ncbi:hypothetical protein O9929_18700 [Vibrio lentus]|nr:hypothetical protein [Vibrio lentus]